MAASSSRAQEKGYIYDVFLSFRGVDSRKNFSDHLYTALIEAGLRTFRDNEELERGKNIKSSLEMAIRDSMSAIVVFSRSYASSRWCLNEIVKIVECKRENSNFIILPVFYDVDPSEVRWQDGCFREAFDKHEGKIEAESDPKIKRQLMNRVSLWRKALKEVADLSGMPLKSLANDGHEANFVRKIVREMEDKLYRMVMAVTQHLVGLTYRARNIEMWLQDDGSSVDVYVIYGIGGIGKTTLAKVVFNSNFQRFERCSFLSNIRDISGKTGLLCLQKQLLYDISKEKKNKLFNIDQATVKIGHLIRCKKVFVVLDDIEDMSQFDTLLGTQKFYPGSKIIITTRNKWLLMPHEVRYKLSEVEELDADESLKLFCQFAFGQDHPMEAYLEQSKMAVNSCGGIPLALQVLGSSLAGSDASVWRSALQKLESIPNALIHNILLISYHSLQDDHDKNLFLHISCFFVGEDLDETIKILDGCGFSTLVGIQSLIDKCLITIDENKLRMHQLLQEMGREIIRQDSPNDLGRRSRLWNHKDSFQVLQEKMGTSCIQGLILDRHMLKKDNFLRTTADDGNSVKNRHEMVFDKYSLSTRKITNWLERSNEVELEVDAFVRMKNIMLLQLNYIKLTGSYKRFPRNLRWLCWHGFPLRSIPTDLTLEKLVVLDMRYSKLEIIWHQDGFLPSLRILNLSYSETLVRTPDFCRVPNLESLILKGCVNLKVVCESIAMAVRLDLLDLEDCQNLRNLPKMVNFAGTLIISGCLHLIIWDDRCRKFNKLETMGSDLIYAVEMAIGKVLGLASLSQNIKKLSLANCLLYDHSFDGYLPPMLEELDLSQNLFTVLPRFVKALTQLRKLNLSACSRLCSIVDLPPALDTLRVSDCESLERIRGIEDLVYFNCDRCKRLVEVQGRFILAPIKSVGIKSFLGIPRALALNWYFRSENTTLMVYDAITLSISKRPIQVLHEFGIMSTSIPLRKNQSKRYDMKSSITCSVLLCSTTIHKYLGLRFSFVYALYPSVNHPSECKFEEFRPQPFMIRINNKTKGLNWIYTPTFFAVPAYNQDLEFISVWKFTDQMDYGDEIHASVMVENNYVVKMCRISFFYYKKDEMIVKLRDRDIRGKAYIFGSQNGVTSLLYKDPIDIQNHWIWRMIANCSDIRDVEVMDWSGLHLEWRFEEEVICNMMPPSSAIQIFVKNGSGNTMTLFVYPTDTIKVLKERIHQKMGLPASILKLYFSGKRLEDYEDLASYGIERDSTLNVGLYGAEAPVERLILYRSNKPVSRLQKSTSYKRLKQMIEKKTEKRIGEMVVSTYKKARKK